MQTGFKPYKKDFDYSYALGAFPTIELINSRPESCIKVLVSESFRSDGWSSLCAVCRKNGIEIVTDDKTIRRLSPKENCYVIGIFNKYKCSLDANKSHVALSNPSNMGNIGTIVRTMLGFGIKDLAIIGGGVDILDPKAVRASMGAIFHINFAYFDSIEAYSEKFAGHELYPFMLDGEYELDSLSVPDGQLFTLIFGNEATGLDPKYHELGHSVVIRHSRDIDSLNLSVSVGIALYQFSKSIK
jgi:TrmH family RNA methyltransferase